MIANKPLRYTLLVISIALIIFGVIKQLEKQRLIKYTNIAGEYAQQGNHEKAIEYFQMIIDENPKISGAYIGIATEYAQLNNYEQAVGYCSQASTIDPQIRSKKVFEICTALEKIKR